MKTAKKQKNHGKPIKPNHCKPSHLQRKTNNSRNAVKTILEYLAAGDTMEAILEAYPFLEKDDIRACIVFAMQAMDRNTESLRIAV